MRYTFATLIALVTLVLCGETRAADAKEFTPRNEMFTIMIPAGEHSGAQRRILIIRNRRVPVEAAESKTEDGVVYAGASIGIPAVVMRDLPRDERIDILGDAIVKGMEGKIRSKKDISQDPVPGKEFDVETKDGQVRLQLYNVAGWVMYAFVQGKDAQALKAKDADAFFGSFKLSDKARNAYAKVKR